VLEIGKVRWKKLGPIILFDLRRLVERAGLSIQSGDGEVAVVHGKSFGWRSFTLFGICILLVSGVVGRELANETRGSRASRVPQGVHGPCWLLAGPELAKTVPAPQRIEAERGIEAFRAGRIESAIAVFRSLGLDLPENAVIQSNLGALYLS
jgi:hypothetical protein